MPGFFYFFLSNRFFTVVEGRVYRSAQLSGNYLQEVIKTYGIKTVINLRGEHDGASWYEREKDITSENNVKLYSVRLFPHSLPDYDKVNLILDILLNERKPVLIHCRRGADRTGLVSAIALSLEGDVPLQKLKGQFSFRYGVLPFYKSIGPMFFSRYEQWIAKTGERHNRKTFTYWIRNAYIDNHGNLKYWIDSVNNMPVNNERKVFVRPEAGGFLVKGWAFDYQAKGVPEVLYIGIDNLYSEAIFKYNKPGVAKFFNLGEGLYDDFRVGWEASLKDVDFKAGCRKFYLRFKNKRNEKMRDISTEFQVCAGYY